MYYFCAVTCASLLVIMRLSRRKYTKATHCIVHILAQRDVVNNDQPSYNRALLSNIHRNIKIPKKTKLCNISTTQTVHMDLLNVVYNIYYKYFGGDYNKKRFTITHASYAVSLLLFYVCSDVSRVRRRLSRRADDARHGYNNRQQCRRRYNGILSQCFQYLCSSQCLLDVVIGCC